MRDKHHCNSCNVSVIRTKSNHTDVDNKVDEVDDITTIPTTILISSFNIIMKIIRIMILLTSPFPLLFTVLSVLHLPHSTHITSEK